MNKKLNGFTLIEMTIAICVIAILSAAMVPNITKKLHTKAKANANQLTSDCAQFNFKFKTPQQSSEVEYKDYCKSCYEHKCVSCKLNYLDGYVIIQDTCSYKKCSDLHGSSCKLMCSEFECLDGLAQESWNYGYQTQDGSAGLTGIQ